MRGLDMNSWPGGPPYGEWWPDYYFTLLLMAALLFVGFRRGWAAGALACGAVIALRYAAYWLSRRWSGHSKEHR
jgi:hypothetical protein